MELYNYFVGEHNLLAGKTIRDAGLRENANALVVGIERNNERILNPESDITLQSGDNLFIVANRKQLKAILSRFDKK